MKRTCVMLLVSVVAAPAWGADPRREAVIALEAAGIEPYQDADEMARRAAAAAIDEAMVTGWIERIFSCLPTNQACTRVGVGGEPEGTLFQLLGEVGGKASMPLLWRLSARLIWEADRTMERILARGMVEAHKPCAPPTQAKVAAARADLADFLTLRTRGGALVAEPLTAREKDDLAYFMAAVGRHDPDRAAPAGTHLPTLSPDATRDGLAAEVEAASAKGDLEGVAIAARKYLQTLGYPKELRAADESAWGWHGGRHSNLMRTLAKANEVLGAYSEAADLYRRADPGGGACGTGVSYVWKGQIEGLIRSEEQLHGCEAVVAERLLAIDGSNRAGAVYGPERLRVAGFDLERLLRGALVTAGRDGEDLEKLLATDARALERQRQRGPEAWEWKVRAVEGLADTAKRKALPTLYELGSSADPHLAARAIAAIGLLGYRQRWPCGGMSGFGSGDWSRPVESLDEDAHPFAEAERAELARRIVAFALTGPMRVRQSAIEALEAIASPVARVELKRLAADPTRDPDVCQPTGKGEECVPVLAYREKATKALERIGEFEDAVKRCKYP
jgi:hypothetical protein